MINLKEKKVFANEAAKLLNVKNARSVTRLCKLGKLKPCIKISERWQIPLSTIKKYLKEKSNE